MNKSIFTMLLLIVVFYECTSQTRTICGKVVSTYNEPMPGVNVILKGTIIGTSTDQHGEFCINVPPDEKIVLLFSAMCPVLEKKISNDQNYIKVKFDLGESNHALYGLIGANVNVTHSGFGMNYAIGYRYLYYRFGLGSEFNYIQNKKSDENESGFDQIGIPLMAYWSFVPTRFTAYLGPGYYWAINNSSNNDIKLLVGLSYELNRFAFDIRYLNGFNQISDEVNSKRKNLCVGVRYRFH